MVLEEAGRLDVLNMEVLVVVECRALVMTWKRLVTNNKPVRIFIFAASWFGKCDGFEYCYGSSAL